MTVAFSVNPVKMKSCLRLLLGVYDGHGGKRVSRIAKQRVFPYLVENIKSGLGIIDSFQNAFGRVSKEIYEDQVRTGALSNYLMCTQTLDLQGSTAVTVLLEDDKIWSGNIGDSRAVLCRNGHAVDLTTDHKPNLDSERKRIEALGMC